MDYINCDVYRDECRAQVNKFSGSRYKKFQTEAEACEFITKHRKDAGT